MNIFEGARRIAKVITVLVIATATLISFTTHPYFNKYYAYTPSGGVRSVDGCDGGYSFLAHVKDTPKWSTVTMCGYSEGPSEIELSSASVEIINREISARVASSIGETAGGTIAGLAIGWLLVWCIGWIIRGFLGIPRGQDYRIAPVEK